MGVPELVGALVAACEGREPSQVVEVEASVLLSAKDELKHVQYLQKELEMARDEASMKPSVARKLNEKIRGLEAELEQLRTNKQVGKLEKKVQFLEHELKQSYTTKNFTLKSGLLELEKQYRAHINVNPAMAAFWDDITVLLDDKKDRIKGPPAAVVLGRTPRSSSSSGQPADDRPCSANSPQHFHLARGLLQSSGECTPTATAAGDQLDALLLNCDTQAANQKLQSHPPSGVQVQVEAFNEVAAAAPTGLPAGEAISSSHAETGEMVLHHGASFRVVHAQPAAADVQVSSSTVSAAQQATAATEAGIAAAGKPAVLGVHGSSDVQQQQQQQEHHTVQQLTDDYMRKLKSIRFTSMMRHSIQADTGDQQAGGAEHGEADGQQEAEQMQQSRASQGAGIMPTVLQLVEQFLSQLQQHGATLLLLPANGAAQPAAAAVATGNAAYQEEQQQIVLELLHQFIEVNGSALAPPSATSAAQRAPVGQSASPSLPPAAAGISTNIVSGAPAGVSSSSSNNSAGGNTVSTQQHPLAADVSTQSGAALAAEAAVQTDPVALSAPAMQPQKVSKSDVSVQAKSIELADASTAHAVEPICPSETAEAEPSSPVSADADWSQQEGVQGSSTAAPAMAAAAAASPAVAATEIAEPYEALLVMPAASIAGSAGSSMYQSAAVEASQPEVSAMSGGSSSSELPGAQEQISVTIQPAAAVPNTSAQPIQHIGAAVRAFAASDAAAAAAAAGAGESDNGSGIIYFASGSELHINKAAVGQQLDLLDQLQKQREAAVVAANAQQIAGSVDAIETAASLSDGAASSRSGHEKGMFDLHSVTQELSQLREHNIELAASLQVTQSLVDHLNKSMKQAVDKADDAEAETVQTRRQLEATHSSLQQLQAEQAELTSLLIEAKVEIAEKNGELLKLVRNLRRAVEQPRNTATMVQELQEILAGTETTALNVPSTSSTTGAQATPVGPQQAEGGQAAAAGGRLAGFGAGLREVFSAGSGGVLRRGASDGGGDQLSQGGTPVGDSTGRRTSEK